MKKAIFISDLHLHPNYPKLTEKFFRFIKSMALETKALYILGDFIHAWAGDDDIDDWSMTIINQLSYLANQGVKIFFLAGNRDFLIGKRFIQLAKMTALPDPALIKIDNLKILLTHGDQYCLNDKKHQYFRKLTRTDYFKKIFLSLPLYFRKRLVQKVRKISAIKKPKSPYLFVPSQKALISDFQRYQADIIVQGHVHTPQKKQVLIKNKYFYHFILSDWDGIVQQLCYNRARGLEFFCLE